MHEALAFSGIKNEKLFRVILSRLHINS